MSRKHLKASPTLYYTEYFLILTPEVTRCISISAFVSLIGIPIGITT